MVNFSEDELEHYTRLIYHLMKKYRWFTARFPYLREDMVQECFYTICQCKLRFKEDGPAQFSSYIYRPIKWTLYLFVAQWLGKHDAVKNQDTWDRVTSYESLMTTFMKEGEAFDESKLGFLSKEDENYNMVEYMESLPDNLTKNERFILNQMMKGYYMTELARERGVSHQAIQCAHERAVKKIKKVLKK